MINCLLYKPFEHLSDCEIIQDKCEVLQITLSKLIEADYFYSNQLQQVHIANAGVCLDFKSKFWHSLNIICSYKCNPQVRQQA